MQLNTSTSVIDAFKAKGLDYSYANRAKYAQQYGMTGYAGTASQNTELARLVTTGALPEGSKTGSIVTNSASAQNTNSSNINTLTNLNAGVNGAVGANGMVTDQNGNMSSQTSQSQTQTTEANGANGEIANAMQTMQKEQVDAMNKIKESYEKLKVGNDALYAKTIDGINSRFDGLRTQLTNVNSTFTDKVTQNQYNINGFRYTPQQAEGMIYQAETAGINKLQDLEGERAQAIIKANEAKQNDDARMLNEQMDLVQQNFENRMKVINQMQDYAKSISTQIENSKKAEATAYASMYKDIDQIVPYYDSMATPAQKEQFIQEYAKKTGADPEMIRSTLTNYTKSQLAYKQGTSVANNKAVVAKTTTAKSTAKKATAKTTPTYSGDTVDDEVPDTPEKRATEIKTSVDNIKATNPSYFDQNGYLYPELVDEVVSGLIKQGYPKAEVDKALDGYIYNKEDDGWLERTATSLFKYKR